MLGPLSEVLMERILEDSQNRHAHFDDMRITGVWGFSGAPFRCLVNNLCRVAAPVTYLEVGVFCGATLAAAMCGNAGRFIGVDNFSFAGMVPHLPREYADNPKEFCRRSVQGVIEMFGQGKGTCIEQACLNVDVETLPLIDIFLFDGDHTRESTALGIAHYIPRLAPHAILLVDDFESPEVSAGVGDALRETKMALGLKYATSNTRWGTSVFVGQRANGVV